MLHTIHRAAYWIGVGLVALCLGVVFAQNTELIGRFERGRVPLSWMIAGGAMLAFIVAECFKPAPGTTQAQDSVKPAQPAEAMFSPENPSPGGRDPGGSPRPGYGGSGAVAKTESNAPDQAANDALRNFPS